MARDDLIRGNNRTPSDVLRSGDGRGNKEYLASVNHNDAQRTEIRSAHKAAGTRSFLTGLSYLLITLFTVFFIFDKITYGGFYVVDNHKLAMIILLGAIGLLLLMTICFFVIGRVHKRTGAQAIRSLLWFFAFIIAAVSFIILGAWGYLVIIAALAVASEAYVGVSNRLKKGKSIGKGALAALTAVTVIMITLAIIISAGVMPLATADSYVEMTAFNRSVKYVMGSEGEASLEKVMLTVNDTLAIRSTDVYEVLDTVTIGGEECSVVTIGDKAFVGVRSIGQIVLPSTVTRIERGAFSGSTVDTVRITSESITIEDGLCDSGVRCLYIPAGLMTEITLGYGSELGADVTVSVSKYDIDAMRLANPDIQSHIVARVDDDEIYLNYDISAPDNAGAVSGYLNTDIITLAQEQSASLSLPFPELITYHEEYGYHWYYEENGRVFRMLSIITDGGDEIYANAEGSLTVSQSCSLSLVWKEYFGVYADLTSIGGEVIRLHEFSSDESYYQPDGNYKSDLLIGYTCREWYTNSDFGKGEAVSRLTDLTRNYTLYPSFTLDGATVELGETAFTYNAVTQYVTATLSHPIAEAELICRWESEDGTVVLSDSNCLEVCDVSDSGTYILWVTVRLDNGEQCENKHTVSVTVAPATLNITADSKRVTYGDAAEPLTYSYDGLLGTDTLAVSLTRVAGDAAGAYPITLESVEVSDNYAVNFVGAHYTVDKADYDMGGVTLSDASFVYDGDAHGLEISGTLPTGLDGISLTVTYSGSATHVSDGSVAVVASFATESNNYNVPESMTAYVSITPRTVRVIARDVTVQYGDAEAELTYTESGILFFESLTTDVLTGSLEREAGDTPGEYAITIGTLTATGSDYVIDFTGATYTVTSRVIEVPTVEQTVFAYTGSTVVLLDDSEYYTVENGSASDVGSYVAAVTLTSQYYVWSDSSFAGSIEWSISEDATI